MNIEKITEEDRSRFWEKVNREGPLPDQSQQPYKGLGKCWEWIASLRRTGYGQFTIHGASRACHRIAWMMTFGSIPPGQCVLHRCDNPKCVNPSHLRLGTQQENLADMSQKGRNQRGDDHWARRHPEMVASGDRNWTRRYPHLVKKGSEKHGAKLKESDIPKIHEMRKSGLLFREIGSAFGVSESIIRRIIRRKIWKHIPADAFQLP